MILTNFILKVGNIYIFYTRQFVLKYINKQHKQI